MACIVTSHTEVVNLYSSTYISALILSVSLNFQTELLLLFYMYLWILTGVFKDDGPYSVYISTDGVKELYATTLAEPLKLGANVNLARAMDVFKYMAQAHPGFQHLQVLADHWQVVANVAVRNVSVRMLL